MNNEPVAELLVNDGEPWGCRYSDEGTFFNADGSRMDGWIPLYTHPVKEQEFTSGKKCPSCGCNSLFKTNRSEWCVTHKCLWQSDYDLELTDEEILEVWDEDCVVLDEDKLVIRFAKAILRKAQEK